MSSIVVLNGELLPRSGARISVDDAGFLLGDGVFETLRADDGEPQLVGAHLERLDRSLAAIGIVLPWRLDELRTQVDLVLDANGLQAGTACVRITVTRGLAAKRWTAAGSGVQPAPPAPAARLETPAAAVSPTVLLTAEPYEPPPAQAYASGVAVALSEQVRHVHPLHRLKSTSYACNLWLRREAVDATTYDVLQYNDAGCLAEGSATNVFVVEADEVLRTPGLEDGCLDGVTRAVVLEIAGQLGYRVRQGGIDRARFAAAREIFLTNSLVEILPVRRAGSWQPLNCPGPVTQSLREAFVRRVRGRAAIEATRSPGAVQRDAPWHGKSDTASSHE